MRDTLSTGRTFRCLVVMDEYTREVLAIAVAHSIPSARVIEALERLRVERDLPPVIITDNGSEFASRAFDAWAYARNIKIDHIQPGETDPELLRGKPQRQLARRVTEHALVPYVAGRPAGHRALAGRLQSRSTRQLIWRTKSGGVRV